MPRAHRYYMPGYIWHLTHRCHRKQFLLRYKRDRLAWVRWLYEARCGYLFGPALSFTQTPSPSPTLTPPPDGDGCGIEATPACSVTLWVYLGIVFAITRRQRRRLSQAVRNSGSSSPAT